MPYPKIQPPRDRPVGLPAVMGLAMARVIYRLGKWVYRRGAMGLNWGMKTLLMSLSLGLIFAAQAELPPFVYDEMKRDAEEVVVVQILKAPKADAKLIGKRQQLIYEAKVLRITRSKSRLRPSATITIQSSYYTFGPGEVGPSNPRRLKKNDVVTAYLNKGKKAGEFQIAAGGHSF